MPEFAYSARSLTGEDVTGMISAASKRDALAMLSERSLFPLRVESRQGGKPWFEWKRKIKVPMIAASLTQLADLLQNGVPLLGALDILSEQAPHPALCEVFGEVRDQLAEGGSLDAILAKYPHIFDALMISMVRAGVEGAFLEDALKRTADFMEQQEEVKGRVIAAMMYPAILMSAGTVIVTVMIVFFVPRFADLFARLEQEGGLPGPTIALLAISDTIRDYGVFIAAGLVAAGVGASRYLKTPPGRLLADQWKIKIPVAGPIFLMSAISRFCRVLGTLLKNGVPLLRSLEISSDSAGNIVLANALRQSAEQISSGESLSKPLAKCGLIPRGVMAMITTAEESNNLDQVLINVADGIDRRNARQLDMMVRLLEPVMLLVLGGVILFVLVGLLLPVFDMSAAM
jgi:type II secretory pathway component PulF